MSNSTDGTTALALRPDAVTAMAEATGFSVAQIHVVKRALFKGEGDEGDLWLFLTTAKRWNADPFRKEIHAVFRWDNRAGKKVMAIQVGIDQLRRLGKKTARFRGMVGPYWKAKGKDWTELWEEDANPYAAKVGIYMKDCPEPIWGIVKWSEFAQKDRDGKLLGLWGAMPSNQLAKCAEAQAWRKCLEDTDDVQVIEEIAAKDEADQVEAETQHRRDETALTVPRAASPRFHTYGAEPRDVVLPSGRVFTSAEEMAAPEDPEPAEPIEETDIDTLGTAMPEEIAQLLAGAVRQAITGEPLAMTPVAGATALRGASNRLKLFASYGEPGRRAALLAALHFAQTGEMASDATVNGAIDRRWLVWLQEAPNATIEALGVAADWWLARKGEVLT